MFIEEKLEETENCKKENKNRHNSILQKIHIHIHPDFLISHL